jgi:hypothetical protein
MRKYTIGNREIYHIPEYREPKKPAEKWVFEGENGRGVRIPLYEEVARQQALKKNGLAQKGCYP